MPKSVRGGGLGWSYEIIFMGLSHFAEGYLTLFLDFDMIVIFEKQSSSSVSLLCFVKKKG